TMRVTIIAFGVFFPVFVLTVTGANVVTKERYDVASMFGLNRVSVLFRIVFPSALPSIGAGVRIALPIGLIMMIVSELTGGLDGLGGYLTLKQELFDMGGMMVAIIILAIVGALLNGLYAIFES